MTENTCSTQPVAFNSSALKLDQSKKSDAQAANRFLIRELSEVGDEAIFLRSECERLHDVNNYLERRAKSDSKKLSSTIASGETQFNVGDKILTPGFRGWRTYSVEGVFLGALGQESAVNLLAHGVNPPSAYGMVASIMLIPVEMLVSGIRCGLFKHEPKLFKLGSLEHFHSRPASKAKDVPLADRVTAQE